MHDAAYLHIRARDGRATRIVSLTEPSVRIGRGRSCEVRLDDPTLAEVECLLRRRGSSWHLQPVEFSGRLTLDGRPADRPRSLPMGSTLRIADRWLTLLPSMDAPEHDPVLEPEPRPWAESATVIDVDEPVPDPEPAPAATATAIEPDEDDGNGSADPLEGQRSELARLEARLRQRERWLKDRLHERQWEARWRAAGASLKNRSRSAHQPEPRPRPSAAPLKPSVAPEPSLRARREAVPPAAPRFDRPATNEPPSYSGPVTRQPAKPPRSPIEPEARDRRPAPTPPPIEEPPLPAEPSSRALRVTEEVVPVEELLLAPSAATRVEPETPSPVETAPVKAEAEAEVEARAATAPAPSSFDSAEPVTADPLPIAPDPGPADPVPSEPAGPVGAADLRVEAVVVTPIPEPTEPLAPQVPAEESADPTDSIKHQAAGITVDPPTDQTAPTEPADAPIGGVAGAILAPVADASGPGNTANGTPDPEPEEAETLPPEASAERPASSPSTELMLASDWQPLIAPVESVEMVEPADPASSIEAIEPVEDQGPEQKQRSWRSLPMIGLNDLVSFLSKSPIEQETAADPEVTPDEEPAATPGPVSRESEPFAPRPAEPQDQIEPEDVPGEIEHTAGSEVEAEAEAHQAEEAPEEHPGRFESDGFEEEEAPEPMVGLSGDWPSAKAILVAQPQQMKRKAGGRPQKVASLPLPTERIAPDGWTVPGGAWLCIPLMFATLAAGVLGVRLAWTWAEIDRDTGRLADQLASGRRPEGGRLELLLEREQELPMAHWWNSTSDQMIMRAALLSGQGIGYDRSTQERAGDLLHAASANAPGHPSLRFARAWRAVQEPGHDAPSLAVGLSRDVWSLAWSGRALLAEGKTESAKRAYRSALEMACRAQPDPATHPTFHEEPRGGRFGLPLEEVIRVIVADMADRPEWGTEDWEDVLPDFAEAWLVAARLLRQRGDSAADRAIERAIALGDEPAPEGCSPALHEAATAEALALAGRFEEAVERYTSAVDRLSKAEEVARRPWMFNLSALYGELRESRQERVCLLAAMITDPNDPVTNQAIQTQLRKRMSLAGTEGGEAEETDLSVTARPSRSRILGE